MDKLLSAFGEYSLQRMPLRDKETLRAWDAADELILHTLAYNESIPSNNSKLLIINDQFGALATTLHQFNITSWGDSYIGELSINNNFSVNKILPQSALIPSTKTPSGSFDIVIIKIPKTLALLEHQLSILQNHINENTIIIGAAMVKHIHKSTLALFEKYIGTTTTSLAKKKARLVFSKNQQKEKISSPYPTVYIDDTLDLTLSNNANVFSRESLDIGARFMIEQFKQLPKATTIIDLGCGNGVLGIMAKRQIPSANISFIDESYMATDSAKTNFEHAFNHDKSAQFITADSLTNVQTDNPDIVLCNPPFHQHHTIGDHIAWRMISQSYKTLKSNGQLWVVGNRQLAYHSKIKRLFGNCETIAANKKFIVLVGEK